MNDDIAERILREIQEQKSDLRAFGLALNSHNTEIVRMSVELKHLTEQQAKIAEAQTAIQQHDRRIGNLESSVATKEKTEQRLGDQQRAIFGLTVTTIISLIGLVFTLVQMFIKK